MEYDFSNFPETWETVELYPWPSKLLNALQGLGTTAGLLANAFLLVLFAATPHLRTVSSMLLLQRAIADVLDLIVFPFIIYQRANAFLLFDQATCIWLNIFLHVGEVASRVLLMAFTLVSYQAAYPQHYAHPYRRKTMRVTSTVAWVLAAAAGVAACFLGYSNEKENCTFSPLFDSYPITNIVLQIPVLCVIPMVVVCALIPPRSPKSSARLSAGRGGPNRRLLLGLASSFTVLHGLYWLVLLIDRFLPLRAIFFITPVAYSLTTFGKSLNAILVICQSEELRGKAAEWLLSRHTTSVPLRDLESPSHSAHSHPAATTATEAADEACTAAQAGIARTSPTNEIFASLFHVKKCLNCDRPHRTFAYTCPKRKEADQEKEEERVKNDGSYAQATSSSASKTTQHMSIPQNAMANDQISKMVMCLIHAHTLNDVYPDSFQHTLADSLALNNLPTVILPNNPPSKEILKNILPTPTVPIEPTTTTQEEVTETLEEHLELTEEGSD